MSVLTEERADQLSLQPMVSDNTASFGTAFTVSIEVKQGVTTGISAADRAQTIRVAVADGGSVEDLARPGHIFPLRAHSECMIGDQLQMAKARIARQENGILLYMRQEGRGIGLVTNSRLMLYRTMATTRLRPMKCSGLRQVSVTMLLGPRSYVA